MIYLLHYDRPLHHAQHYLGSCDDPQRIQDHGNGTSRARLPQVFCQLGVQFVVARTWEGGRTDERKLKNRKNARVLCPICRTHKLRIRARQQRTRRVQRRLPFPNLKPVESTCVLDLTPLAHRPLESFKKFLLSTRAAETSQ